MLNVRYLLLLLGCYFGLTAFAEAGSGSLKLMHIGNSFSQNSTEYLPALAKAGGKKITIFGATKGGCSLQCHAEFLKLAQQNKTEGSAYTLAGAQQSTESTAQSISLTDALKAEQWDVITVQQASRQSIDPASFEPYGEMLISQIKRDAPGAEIMLHKTWAYHDEHRMFKEQQSKKKPVNHVDMHNQLTQAYNQFAARYSLAIIPSADAMFLAYQQLLKEDNVGIAADKLSYIRHSSKMLYSNDGYHLEIAGKYLTASVWYEVLFNESVVDVDFVPKGLDAEFAAELRMLAHQAVTQHNKQ